MTVCTRYEDDLALYVEGDLTGSEARALEAHLEGCAACDHFLAELRASQGAVKELAAEPLDESALAFVRTRIASRGTHRPFRLPAAWRWTIAASLAAAAATVLWLAKPNVQAPDAAAKTAIQPTAAPAVEAQSEPPRIAAARLAEPPSERKRSRARLQRRTTPPLAQPDTTFGLSPEDADQLARAVVAMSRVERVSEDGDHAPPAFEPTAFVQVATADPNVAIYWRLDTNGGEQ